MRINRVTPIVWNVVLAFIVTATGRAQQPEPLSIARQGYLFAGGKYSTVNGKEVYGGQIYVEYQIPARQTSPYPIVMMHSAAVYKGTPDGREGWGTYFLRKGYAVYLADEVGYGRSGYQGELLGPPPSKSPSVKDTQEAITSELFNQWPNAHLHTQRPGTGKPGDPYFDNFHAMSHVPLKRNAPNLEMLNRDAIIALLEKIGPSILVTHSHSGQRGWLVVDKRPDLVKAIIAIEVGLPFYKPDLVGAPDWYKFGELSKPWGLTVEPLTYSPPAAKAEEIKVVQQEKPDRPNLMRCWVQKEPARQLPNFQKVPIMLLTAEAYDHGSEDHCFVKYFEQAGVHPTWIYLPDLGIRGNSHDMMLEKNNLDIAEVLHNWIAKTLADHPQK